MVWAILDENVLGLNDAGFAVSMAQQKWVDFVGYYHANACGFSFLDGHAEIKKWNDARVLTATAINITRDPNSDNLAWLAERSTSK